MNMSQNLVSAFSRTVTMIIIDTTRRVNPVYGDISDAIVPLRVYISNPPDLPTQNISQDTIKQIHNF